MFDVDTELWRFLITSSVCLWIYALDQIISMRPQQGWALYSAFLLVFFGVIVSRKMETSDLAEPYMCKSQEHAEMIASIGCQSW